MSRLVCAAAIAFMAIAAACGLVPMKSIPAATGSAINVTGTVAWTPPVACPSGEVCDPPNSPSVLIFTQAGRADVSTPIDAGRTFSLHLDPGSYTIRVGPPPLSGRLVPSEVRVPSTGSVQLLLSIVPTAG